MFKFNRLFKALFVALFVTIFATAYWWTHTDEKVYTDEKEQRCIVMPVYAGLCDQMQYYIVGKKLEKLGYKVKYDISRFNGSCDEAAKSPNVRTFQLLKAFPNIDFDITTNEEIKFYKKKNDVNPCDFNDKTWTLNPAPWKLEGYVGDFTYFECETVSWGKCEDIMSSGKAFIQECFCINNNSYKALDEQNMKVLEKIQKAKCPIGVHVRRGDMVGNLDHLAYDYDYFVEAIKVATKMFPDASFFFFSEEPSYIEQEILPRLNPNIEVEVAKNDANKCYMDLLLLAACKHVIASQGAMGPMAFILNKHPDKKLIVPTRFKSWVADLKLDVIIPW